MFKFDELKTTKKERTKYKKEIKKDRKKERKKGRQTKTDKEKLMDTHLAVEGFTWHWNA